MVTPHTVEVQRPLGAEPQVCSPYVNHLPLAPVLPVLAAAVASEGEQPRLL